MLALPTHPLMGAHVLVTERKGGGGPSVRAHTPHCLYPFTHWGPARGRDARGKTRGKDWELQALSKPASRPALFLQLRVVSSPGCLMRTFKIYSFGNFQTLNTVVWTLVTVLHTASPEIILYLLMSFTHFATCLPPTSSSLFSIIYELYFVRFHI